MRVGHGFTHLAEEFAAGIHTQIPGPAVFVYGSALDVLHDEPRHALFRRTAIQQFADIGVIQVRQNLPFPQKALHGTGRIHATADEFDGDAAAELVISTLRQIHGAHAALTQGTCDLVGTHAGTQHSFSEEKFRRAGLHNGGQRLRVAGIEGQQGIHFSTQRQQRGLCGTRFVQESGALSGGPVRGAKEEIFHCFPVVHAFFLLKCRKTAGC